MVSARQVGIASLTHHSRNESLNFITYGLKAVAGAGITALVLTRLGKPTLTKLSAASLTCIVLPAAPMLISLIPEQQRNHKLSDALCDAGVAPAAVVGGAQMVFLGSAAMHIWKGAFSALSTAQKIFVPLAMGVSVVELSLLKIGLLSFGIHDHGKNVRKRTENMKQRLAEYDDDDLV